MLITDMTMPDMNGLELAKKMREIDPHKPVIMGDLIQKIREIFDDPVATPEKTA